MNKSQGALSAVLQMALLWSAVLVSSVGSAHQPGYLEAFSKLAPVTQQEARTLFAVIYRLHLSRSGYQIDLGWEIPEGCNHKTFLTRYWLKFKGRQETVVASLPEAEVLDKLKNVTEKNVHAVALSVAGNLQRRYGLTVETQSSKFLAEGNLSWRFHMAPPYQGPRRVMGPGSAPL